jgi:dTDP-4-dehydrorhamnose reductase
MKILILGITGMLGNSMFRFFSNKNTFDVYGTSRSKTPINFFKHVNDKIFYGIDFKDQKKFFDFLVKIKPDVVINCVGITKHKKNINNHLEIVKINTLLPLHMELLAKELNFRFIHISTDCVFSGTKGNYLESDFADAIDFYGRSKFLGEVNGVNCITLRTSIIGHEIETNYGLLNWFLKQNDCVYGFRNAIFSGITTLELSKIISDIILPKSDLDGLYHISSKAINKFDLLTLISAQYNKNIEILPNNDFVIDRSLNSKKFRILTGYEAPEWKSMIKEMFYFQ